VDEIIALVKAGASASELERNAGGADAGPQADYKLEDDLRLVADLLCNLKEDLSRSRDTVERHGSKLEHLDQAIEMLSSADLVRRSRHQLAEELGAVFQLLVSLEDEVTAIRATVGRPGYKSQHKDLEMQMISELGSELIIGSEDQLANSPRLLNLRAVCDKALHAPTG
jgi:hypothetical protein